MGESDIKVWETTLRDLVYGLMVKGIREVIDGEIESFTSKLLYPNIVIEYMVLKLGAIHKDGETFETNGWQWDWWDKVIVNEVTYNLSGSGYYGGVTITREEGER